MVKKIVFISIGSLSLLLAMLGIFLPLLPTTPFLLLSAYLYLRSSQRLYNWLINHPVFGSYIYHYIKYKAIPVKTKITAIIVLWLSMGFSIYIVSNVYLRIMLTLIGGIVTLYLLTLRTLPKHVVK
ncbi:hypothetical protein SAMN04488134_101222 [Amphibacillus marinus]|uniref:Inner membrane protein n=1 Tax=Amphibacillus marinus TaxID=872970 RepID=A0A1H8H2R2_9BACI|nr:YbaN family protein [Amphibacillus marinus]SEN49758.1 hypothetical protein SAMN04488134_101222 [Amphibacillus marinus]